LPATSKQIVEISIPPGVSEAHQLNRYLVHNKGSDAGQQADLNCRRKKEVSDREAEGIRTSIAPPEAGRSSRGDWIRTSDFLLPKQAL
jgi:hypothetical protein